MLELFRNPVSKSMIRHVSPFIQEKISSRERPEIEIETIFSNGETVNTSAKSRVRHVSPLIQQQMSERGRPEREIAFCAKTRVETSAKSRKNTNNQFVANTNNQSWVNTNNHTSLHFITVDIH